MIRLRRSDQRGQTRLGWLDSRHSFSFGDYYDPANMSFRSLRVINEDWVQPGSGFGMHPHRDMEIVTYVLSGALEHRDSLGTGSAIRAGEVQRMSAGTGIRHSEHNPSDSEPVHLVQIWIEPEKRGLPPSYEQHPLASSSSPLRLLASRDGRAESLRLHQDADLYSVLLPSGTRVDRPLDASRHYWAQVLRGGVELNGHDLTAGDAAALGAESALHLGAKSDAEVLLFDLA